MELINKIFIRKNEEIQSAKELCIIQPYMYSREDNEYKAEFHYNYGETFSEWISPKTIEENYIPFEEVCEKFYILPGLQLRERISRKQFAFIFHRYQEYLLADLLLSETIQGSDLL